MFRKLKKFFPWVALGCIVLYTIFWYAAALFFESTIKNLGLKMKEKGVLITASSFYSGGYPTRLQGDFQDVRIQLKKGLVLTAPSLLIRADLLFPFTKTVIVDFEDVATLTQEERSDKLLLTNLIGHVCLSPYSLVLQSDSVSFLRRESPLGELKELLLNVEREPDDKLRTTFEGKAKLWFFDPLASTLEVGLNLSFLLDNWEAFLLEDPTRKGPPREIRFDFEALELRLVGTVLKGTGFLVKPLESSPEASWRGELDLSLQGLSYFFDFLNNFSNQKTLPLMNFLTNVPNFLQKDNFDGFKLPLRVRNGKIEFKGIPFFSFPLFPLTEEK